MAEKKGGGRQAFGLRRPDRELTWLELAAGARASFENAEDLLSDARLLYDSGRNARAVSLACMAHEEIAKATVCEALHAARPGYDKYREPAVFWRFWRDHPRKSAFAATGRDTDLPTALDRLVAVQAGAGRSAKESIEALNRLHAEAVETARDFSDIREFGLYADILEIEAPKRFCRPSWPEQELTPKLAERMLVVISKGVEALRPRISALPLTTRIYRSRVGEAPKTVKARR